MITVAINSAMQQTMVAIMKKGKLVSHKSWPAKRDEAEKILPALSKLIKKNKQHWSDISEVFVITGPGPFTGLRIGVTIANALAWSTGAKVKTANIFEYLLAVLPASMRSQTALIIKGGGDHVGVVFPKTTKEKFVKIEELPTLIKSTKSIKNAKVKYVLAEMKTEDINVLKKVFKTGKTDVQFVDRKKLKTFGQVLPELLRKSKIHRAVIKPLYLQKPHITQSKKPSFT